MLCEVALGNVGGGLLYDDDDSRDDGMVVEHGCFGDAEDGEESALAVPLGLCWRFGVRKAGLSLLKVAC